MARKKDDGLLLFLQIFVICAVGVFRLLSYISIQIKEIFDNKKQNANKSNEVEEVEEARGIFGDGAYHINLARVYRNSNDYFGARIEYLKAVETLKYTKPSIEFDEATLEYDGFVKEDPFFNGIISILIKWIKDNQGILQSEITKKFINADWSEIYNHNRPLSKEDLRYVLYFGDKFGLIQRIKKGRSYELFVKNESLKLREPQK